MTALQPCNPTPVDSVDVNRHQLATALEANLRGLRFRALGQNYPFHQLSLETIEVFVDGQRKITHLVTTSLTYQRGLPQRAILVWFDDGDTDQAVDDDHVIILEACGDVTSLGLIPHQAVYSYSCD